MFWGKINELKTIKNILNDRQREKNVARGNIVQLLDASLSDTSRYTLLFFYSKRCQICNAIRDAAKETIRKHSIGRNCKIKREAGGKVEETRGNLCQTSCIDCIEIDADADLWRPEVVQFGISRVPCFVLISPKSRKAKCKTSIAATSSQEAILKSLSLILDEIR